MGDFEKRQRQEQDSAGRKEELSPARRRGPVEYQRSEQGRGGEKIDGNETSRTDRTMGLRKRKPDPNAGCDAEADASEQARPETGLGFRYANNRYQR